MPVGGANPLSARQALQLQEIVQSLYGALDAGKPAHVGLDFAVVFQETEAIASSIADVPKIKVPLAEPPPLSPILVLAPPGPVGKTSVAAWAMPLPPSIRAAEFQVMQWLPVPWNSAQAYGWTALVTDSCVSPWNPGASAFRPLRRSSGQPPASSPSSWSPLASPAPWQAYLPRAGAYALRPASWSPSMGVFQGEVLLDPNGNLQQAACGGWPQCSAGARQRANACDMRLIIRGHFYGAVPVP